MLSQADSQGDRFRQLALLATAFAAVILVAMSLLGVNVRPLNAALVFLLLTLLVSANFGVRLGLAAALLSNVALFYFFLEPVYEFWAYDAQHVAGLIVFLLVSAIGGSLLENARAHAEDAHRSQAHAEALLELNRAISGHADPEELLSIVCGQAVSALGATGAAILVREDGRWQVVASRGDVTANRAPSPVELSLAGQAASAGESRRLDDQTLALSPQQNETLVPLNAAGRNLGVLRIDAPTDGSEALTIAFAREAALAMSHRDAERQLSQAEALRQADELKTALISSVSHDLKTPLAAIRQAASSLLDTSVNWTDQDRLAFLTLVNQESERLSTTIGDLLDLNRLETGSVSPLLGEESTSQLMEEALALARPRLKGRQVIMEVPDVRIVTDGSLLRHALANLLDNAGTHSRVGGAIRLSGDTEAGHVRLIIQDDGPGIDPEERELVFKPFFKGARYKGPSKGTGLGLAIVRGFVGLCNGSVAIEGSPSMNRFVVTLPLSADCKGTEV